MMALRAAAVLMLVADGYADQAGKLVGATVKSEHEGHSGAGYVDFRNTDVDYISWSVPKGLYTRCIDGLCEQVRCDSLCEQVNYAIGSSSEPDSVEQPHSGQSNRDKKFVVSGPVSPGGLVEPLARTQADHQKKESVAAAVKAWSKEDQDSFGIQQVLDKNHNATLAPGLVLSQAIVMAVPNGGISVTVKATVLSKGTATNEALTTTLALLLHIPVGTISRFEVRPTPYGTVGFHFYIGSTGTPTPAAGESKNNVELVLSLAVAGLALVLLLHAVAVLVSRCQTPKVPKNNDIELEQHKPSVSA